MKKKEGEKGKPSVLTCRSSRTKKDIQFVAFLKVFWGKRSGREKKGKGGYKEI